MERGKIIVVANQKGGVAKTSMSEICPMRWPRWAKRSW